MSAPIHKTEKNWNVFRERSSCPPYLRCVADRAKAYRLRRGCCATPSTAYQSDEAACVSYGFVPGATAYITCVQREIDARRSGKLGPTYDQRLIAPKPAS